VSHKACQSIHVRLADGAFEWRLRPGTEVAADLASPHRDTAAREADKFFVVFLNGGLRLRAASFRYGLRLFLSRGDLLGLLRVTTVYRLEV
jgi:hypothetical protein